ncbi:MAG: TonB-dependent receptor domain-containing protein [Candidatus Acidiferrales bacterium]
MNRTLKAVLVLASVAVLVLPTAAQRITGSVTGQVTDQSGAAVPGATVTVLNEATNAKRTVSTGEDGAFVVDNLAPALYKVTIEASGFQNYQTTATVRVGVATPVNAQMQIGAATSTITVESAAIAVDTQQNTVQGVVTADRIDDLPLNGRNFLSLAQLEPGVQIIDGGNFDPTKNQMVGVSVGGRSGRVTRIQVDGVDITDEVVGTTVANISNESIQEFGISQSTLDVSTDITSSGAVNIITRSGSNDLHGSAAYFWRDESFAADSRLFKPDNNKPPFDREIIAARASGPFIQDRLYWAVDYEYNNQDQQQVVTTPQFPQFTGAFGVPLDERMTSGKLDWVLTDRTKGFYRFQHSYNFGVTGFGGTDLASFANQNNTNIHVIGVDYGSARWTHSGRFSYLNFNNAIVDSNSSAGTPTTLDPGGNPVLVNITSNGINAGPDLLAPQNTFQDNKQFKYDGGYSVGRHTIRFGSTYNKIDQVVFAAFFGNAPRIRSANNATGREFAGLNPFSAGGASDPLNFPVNQFFLGNGLGFFTDKSALGFPFGGQTNHRLGFYAMDTWKVTPDFTLNLGLRYNWNSNLSNHDVPRASAISLFDPTLAGTPRRDNDDFAPQAGFAWNVMGNNKLVIRAGAGIYYETNILNSFLFDVAENIPPGIGLSFISFVDGDGVVNDPAGGPPLFNFNTDCVGLPGNNCFFQTTLPSGNNVTGAALGQVIPFALQANQLFQSAAAALAANFPAPGTQPAFNVNLDTNGHFLDTQYQTPYGAQMNVGFQYEVRSGLVLAVDYVRNRGVHFNQTRDRNRIGAADTLDVAAAQAAIAGTLAACGQPTIAAAIVGCPNFAGGRPATINDFASRGLGAGPGLAVDGNNAFGGENRNFRGIGIIEPMGLSLYQALQVRLTGKLGSWGWIRNLDTNITYSLGRFESSGVDQDFPPSPRSTTARPSSSALPATTAPASSA